MPCIEKTGLLGWVGEFLFIEQQSICCGSMDVFLFLWMFSQVFNVLFCIVPVGSKLEDSEEHTPNRSTSQF